MSRTKLFSIVIPQEITERTPLYIHTSAQSDPRVVSRGETITLDTYFNLFSWTKYLRYTNVSEVTVVFDLAGGWKVELLSHNNQNLDQVIEIKEFLETERRNIAFPISLPDEREEGFLWFRLTALSENCMVFGGEYLTDAPTRTIKLSAVICTFHREEYVIRNVEKIREKLLDPATSSVVGRFMLYVIDNGQSLKGRLPEDSSIQLFYNKNCGGSGGFTRGIMEVLQNGDSSHVLLLDDDIEIDPNVIEKTISFLAHLRPEYDQLHIAGGMLFFDEPMVQHEATARWDGTEHSLKHALNMDDPEQLLRNEGVEDTDYAAWWFLCIPMCCISLNNLPLPLFIKCDDIEYGLRNMRECTVINGIGVWHERFEKKFSTILDYYSIRNELVLNAIYRKRHTFDALWLLLKPHLRAIAYGLTTSVTYVNMAVNDYLEGTKFFLHTDGEQKNKELRDLSPQGYVFQKHSNLQRIWSILSKIFTAGFWRIMYRYFSVALRYLIKHRRADRDLQDNWKELTTMEFWRQQLELTSQ